jgi:hypothetical protein
MRLPAAPILKVLERAATAKGYVGDQSVGETRAVGFSDFCTVVLGIPHETISRVRKRGVITVELADRIACAVGLHPILVWPAEWPVEAPEDDEAADRAAERLYLTRQRLNEAQRKTYQKYKQIA